MSYGQCVLVLLVNVGGYYRDRIVESPYEHSSTCRPARTARDVD